MKANTGKLPQARRAELFVEEIGADLLVYDAEQRRAQRLNATAAWVWRHCDGETTIAQATQLLSAELRQPVDEELIWLSLETLEQAHLLLTPVKRRTEATEESRRVLFQRMAVAGAALLLPMITPLTQAAEAQAADKPMVLNIGTAAGPGLLVTIDHHGSDSLVSSGIAISAISKTASAIRGESEVVDGIAGFTKARGADRAGVVGIAKAGPGMRGFSDAGPGLHGTALNTTGASAGVVGEARASGAGVEGRSKSGYGVAAYSASGTAFYAEAPRAGFFKGDVEVTGDIRLTNADCAEDFDIVDAENIDPGAVMVLSPEGGLQLSDRAYDKRVAGVISGAGDYKPGLILDKRPTGNPRKPVALMGKVFCKVDASYGAIEIGDLLTTSETPGHAMKASDSGKAFGSVLGKALRPWSEGEGLIPILVTLQ